MNKTLEKEEVINNVKKPLKTLYEGVKLPIFKTLLGSLLYMVGTLLVATQADNLSKIQIGNFSDLSPVFTYALMCMIGYVFFYISVVADLAFVDLAAANSVMTDYPALLREFLDAETAMVHLYITRIWSAS